MDGARGLSKGIVPKVGRRLQVGPASVLQCDARTQYGELSFTITKVTLFLVMRCARLPFHVFFHVGIREEIEASCGRLARTLAT
eukprot:5478583-Pleurochrysis_carterae.AAC.1